MSKKEHKANINPWFWLSSSGVKATSDSIVSPFLPLYGVQLGVNPSLIGLLVSITSLLSIVQIIWARMADRLRNSRFIAIFSNYVSGMINFLFAVIQKLGTFVSFRATQSLIASASIPTSATILAERTQTKDWPFWNGLIQAFIVLGTLVGVLIGGFILKKYSGGSGFVIIFIGAGFLSLIASILFHIAVPKKQVLEKRKRWFQVEEVSVTLDNVLAIMKTDKNFMWFSIASFIFIFGVNFSAPFYIIYNTASFSNGGYNLDIFQTAILSSIGFIPQLFFSYLTVKFIEKTRSKEILIIGGLVTSFFPIAFFIPSVMGGTKHTFAVLVVIWVINGIAWGIINTSLSTLVLDIIHPRRRTIQLAISNSLNAFALFIAPILGGLVIPRVILNGEQGNGISFIYLIFIISAIFRLLGSLLFVKVQEPIIGGTILRPINKIIRVPVRMNIEKIVSFISTVPHKIGKRRKSTKTYGKN